MSGSLIVGPYDLLNLSSPALLAGTPMALGAPPSATATSFGSGVPDTTTVARLLLDGDIVSGVRTKNRVLTLPIFVRGSRGLMAKVVADLAATVDQQLWSITWTPDTASPTVVFDCQRGQATQGTNLRAAAQGGTFVTLTIPAAPFTRDALPTVLAPPTTGAGTGTLDALATTTGLTGAPAYTFSYPGDATYAGITGQGTNPGAATLAVDSGFAPPAQSASVKQTTDSVEEIYETTTTTNYWTGTGWYAQTTSSYLYLSDFYFRWHRTTTSLDMSGSAQAAVYAATDLTSVRPFGSTASNNAGKWGGGSDVNRAIFGDWRLTLYSASGSQTWTVNKGIGATDGTVDKTWQRVLFDLTGTPESTTGTFDNTAVTSYRLEHWTWTSNQQDSGKSVWLSQLDVIAGGGGVALSSPYGVIRFDGIKGAARTPVSFTVSAPTAVSTLLIARTPNPPAGYNPVLTGGTGSSTSNTPTGRFSTTVYSHETWTRPALGLSGTYAVLARVYRNSSSGDTVTVTAELGTDTTSTQTASRVFSATDPSAPATSTFGWVTIGTLTLPPRRVDPANTAATITFTYTSPAAAFLVDIMVLVDLSGDQILVQLPTGTTMSQFFIDAPGPQDQRGKISGGLLADRSDAVDVSQWATGLLTNFDPGPNTVTVVADNSPTGVTAQIIYYPKWPGERPVS